MFTRIGLPYDCGEAEAVVEGIWADVGERAGDDKGVGETRTGLECTLVDFFKRLRKDNAGDEELVGECTLAYFGDTITETVHLDGFGNYYVAVQLGYIGR